MSSQADVRSIQALKDFRAILAFYSEEAQGAIGAVKMEAKRTVQWVQHDRKTYWTEKVKRCREQVTSARAEVMRRKLAKTPEHTPAFSEQKELLRQAEAGLREAEMKVALIKKWEPLLQQAVLELYAGIRRISDLSSTNTVRASLLLERIVDALEAYTRVAAPSGVAIVEGATSSTFASIANLIMTEAEAEAECQKEPEPVIDDPPPVDLLD